MYHMTLLELKEAIPHYDLRLHLSIPTMIISVQ